MESKENEWSVVVPIDERSYKFLFKAAIAFYPDVDDAVDVLAANCFLEGFKHMCDLLEAMGVIPESPCSCPFWYPRVSRDEDADIFNKCSVSFNLPESHYLTLLGMAGANHQSIDEYLRERIATVIGTAAGFALLPPDSSEEASVDIVDRQADA